MKFNETVYYENENCEVLSFNYKVKTIDDKYKYVRKNPIYNFFAGLTYKLIATPFAFIAFKIFKNVKFHNKQVLKKHKKGGYFIYANHTNQFCDGFCPGLICYPKKPHIIVDASNVSIPILGTFTKMWGALPLPSGIKTTKNFYQAITLALEKDNPIVIYPEAHLWPYYTKIRKFPDSSFRYPVKFNKPVYTFTTTYKKRKHFKMPKIEIYVDGPFYPNKNLTEKFAQAELCKQVFETLNDRASLSNYEFVKYIKKENLW